MEPATTPTPTPTPTPAPAPAPAPAMYETLALELMEMIMERTSDFATFCSLMYASPRTRSRFTGYSAWYTDINMHPGEGSEIHDLIRLMIAIRLSQVNCPNLNAFINMYVLPIGQDNAGQDLFPEIPYDLPDDTYYSIFLTAYRVWWHTQCCLKYYMDRFVNLKPRHLANKSFRYGPPTTCPWRERPDSYECSKYNTGRPSRLEEEHVTRTLLRLQVQYELQNAAAEGNLGWPAQDIQSLFPLQPGFLWVDEQADGSSPLMDSIMEYLQATEQHWGLAPVDPSSMQPRQLPRPMWNVPISWPDSEDLEPSQKCQPDQLTLHPQPGREFWDELRVDDKSPLSQVDFEPFQKLGFAIWDLQRLCAFGLLEPSEEIWNNKDSRHGMYFAWRSVLTNEELAESDYLAERRYATMIQAAGLRKSYRQQQGIVD